MNFFSIFGVVLLLILGLGINSVHAQIDPFSDIEFFQSGELKTEKNSFEISNEISIREFFNGNIIRISGQTVEGFPYITYSQIINEQLETFGKIFVQGEFLKLIFEDIPTTVEQTKEKQDDLSIITQYTQRVHSKQNILIDVKIFEYKQNKYNDFYQNYAQVSEVNVQVVITDEENNEIFSSNGITDDIGLFETKYLIPDNSKRETYTISINAENDESSSSKIFQVFALGNIPTDSKTIIP